MEGERGFLEEEESAFENNTSSFKVVVRFRSGDMEDKGVREDKR